MNRFLINSGVFIGILMGFLFLILFLYNKTSDFKLPNSKENLIIGHSHSECAFNDELIDGFLNVSLSGEGYFYSYFKLRNLLKSNKQIKRVFFEFTNNQIPYKYDRTIWGTKNINFRFGKYAPFMNLEDLQLLASKNPSDFKANLIKPFQTSLKTLVHNPSFKKRGFGQYKHLDKNNMEAILMDYGDRISIWKKENIKVPDSLSSNIEYLKKMIADCKAKDIQVFFVRSPLHPKYSDDVSNDSYFDFYQREFEDIELLDFAQFPLEDKNYADLQHLNYTGATIFSMWFNKLIKEGLLIQENKQDFIAKQMPVK